MAIFIHLFDAKNKSAIARNGIKQSKSGSYKIDGVYATPQLPSYELTHQWMRELRRFDRQVTLAARFRIADTEQVYVGRYNEQHLLVDAAKAVAIAQNHDRSLGLEVIIPRKIKPQEIIKIYQPPKVTGWRYHPDAHGIKPCGCEYCQLGQPYSRQIRARFERENN